VTLENEAREVVDALIAYFNTTVTQRHAPQDGKAQSGHGSSAESIYGWTQVCPCDGFVNVVCILENVLSSHCMLEFMLWIGVVLAVLITAVLCFAGLKGMGPVGFMQCLCSPFKIMFCCSKWGCGVCQYCMENCDTFCGDDYLAGGKGRRERRRKRRRHKLLDESDDSVESDSEDAVDLEMRGTYAKVDGLGKSLIVDASSDDVALANKLASTSVVYFNIPRFAGSDALTNPGSSFSLAGSLTKQSNKYTFTIPSAMSLQRKHCVGGHHEVLAPPRAIDTKFFTASLSAAKAVWFCSESPQFVVLNEKLV